MSPPGVSVIRRGRQSARVAPWRGDGSIALLTPCPDNPLLSADFVDHCLGVLSLSGYHGVVTGALTPLEQAGFLAAGFDVQEDLRLLGMDLSGEPVPVRPGPVLLPVPRWRRDAILAVDRAAFPDFWRFDGLALADAMRATPSVRLRAAGLRRLAGYAICGLAGTRGYVQRLAVHPDSQHRGVGRRLLLDGLAWMARQGAERAYVNTQLTNHGALRLYVSVGFTEEPVGLSVLATGLS